MTLIITINACLWFFYYESYIVFFGLVNFIGPYKVFLKKKSLQRVCRQLFGGYNNGEEVTIGLY